MTAGSRIGSRLKVFLFAGQSNMAGADSLIAEDGARDLASAGLQTEADRAALFCSGRIGGDGKDRPWGDIRGHTGSSFGEFSDRHGRPFCVHGPEVGFARALFAAGIRGIAIIKTYGNIPKALPGSTWPWGKGREAQSPDYYGQWQVFVRDRLAALAAGGHAWEVAGFVWHQGIDDGTNGESAETYAKRLTKLIADLREEYRAQGAPFILARSFNSPIATPARMAPIRKAQMRVAEQVPRAAWVDVDDQRTVNQHHFTAAGQLVIGRRLGEAYLKVAGVGRTSGPSAPPAEGGSERGKD